MLCSPFHAGPHWHSRPARLILVICPVQRLKPLLTQSLTAQRTNTRQILPLQQLQTRTTTRANMAQLLLNPILSRHSRRIPAPNNHNLALGRSLHRRIHSPPRAVLKRLKLKYPRWSVPQDRLGLVDRLFVKFDARLPAIETHPPVRNALRISRMPDFSIRIEFIARDIIVRQNNLDIILLRLLHQRTHSLAPGLIEQTIPDRDALECLLECKRHAAADDQAVHLPQQIVDQLDLVGDFGAA